MRSLAPDQPLQLTVGIFNFNYVFEVAAGFGLWDAFRRTAAPLNFGRYAARRTLILEMMLCGFVDLRWFGKVTRAVHIAIFSALLFGCSSAEKIAVAETDAVADFERYFPSILGDYLSYPTHKALAVGRHADGRFVFAYRTTQRSKERAITVALDECQKRARWIGLGVDCTLYASDNEVLEQRDEE